MITFIRAAGAGTAGVLSTAEPACGTGDRTLLDVVWRNGRIPLMLSPWWAHVIGVDMSPTARLILRMELDLARCHQQALMRRAASLPDPVGRWTRDGFTCAARPRAVPSDREPVQ